MAHGATCSPIEGGDPLAWFRLRDPFGNRIDVCQVTSDWLP